jgi:uncharacterized protein
MSSRGPSAPLVVALVLAVGVLGLLLWAGLTYDPARAPRATVLLLPLPARVAPPGEAPGAQSEAPEAAPPADTAAAPPAPEPSAPEPPQPEAATPAPAPPAPVPPPAQAPAPPSAAAPPPDHASAPPPPAAPVAVPLGPDALSPAPDPALVEQNKEGPLPIVGPDGRKPWMVYARPFEASNPRPRIAIIVSGLGLSAAATETAIQTLPPAVTLAFNPYGQRLDYWTARARAEGHETLVLVPMEPTNYPANDPGPETLLTTLSPPENRERLNWSLSRFTGYTGVLSLFGSRYTTALESLRPTLEEIRSRGLLFVDSRVSLRSSAFRIAGEIGLPRAINNRFIDVQPAKDEIDRRLDELVKTATTSGFAVGVGQPFPVTIERVAAFVRAADARGLAIAPVSAIVDRQKE